MSILSKRKEKKEAEQLMTDMLFELWEEQFLTNDTSITYANAWDFLPGYELPQNFQCGGIDNAGKFLYVGTDGYVRLTAVEPGTGVPQEYVDQQDQRVLETATERLDAGKLELRRELQQEKDTREERDEGLLNDINQLNDRVVDIERQEDTWNGKSTVTVSPTGTATHEISYITVNDEEYKIAGGGGVSQIQSDYTQTDDTKVDFIKNKPDLSVYALAQNVYAKSEVYNKTEIDSMIGNVETVLERLTTGTGA